MTLEKTIEKYFCKYAEKLGLIQFKMTNGHGMPDRIVLHKGKTYFVELKAPGKKPFGLQMTQINVLKSNGFSVYILDNTESIRNLLEKIKGENNDS